MNGSSLGHRAVGTLLAAWVGALSIAGGSNPTAAQSAHLAKSPPTQLQIVGHAEEPIEQVPRTELRVNVPDKTVLAANTSPAATARHEVLPPGPGDSLPSLRLSTTPVTELRFRPPTEPSPEAVAPGAHLDAREAAAAVSEKPAAAADPFDALQALGQLRRSQGSSAVSARSEAAPLGHPALEADDCWRLRQSVRLISYDEDATRPEARQHESRPPSEAAPLEPMPISADDTRRMRASP